MPPRILDSPPNDLRSSSGVLLIFGPGNESPLLATIRNCMSQVRCPLTVVGDGQSPIGLRQITEGAATVRGEMRQRGSVSKRLLALPIVSQQGGMNGEDHKIKIGSTNTDSQEGYVSAASFLDAVSAGETTADERSEVLWWLEYEGATLSSEQPEGPAAGGIDRLLTFAGEPHDRSDKTADLLATFAWFPNHAYNDISATTLADMYQGVTASGYTPGVPYAMCVGLSDRERGEEESVARIV